MKKAFLLLLIFSFKLHSYESFIEISNTVTLENETITVIVDSNSDQKLWNSYTYNTTDKFLKALEKYVKAEFPGPELFKIKGRDEIYYEDPKSENYGKRVGGANFWDYIGIEYEISQIGNPALLLHEIGHYYFGYPLDISDYEMSWLIEGLVSYLPIAMYDSGEFHLTEDEYNSIFNHWGYYNSDIDKERPLINDFRWESSDLFSRYYMKSFKITHIIYKELGTEDFRSFVISLYKQKDHILKMPDLIKLLSEYKKTDWDSIFSGWVYKGSFARKELTAFIDSDSDTILNIDEYYFKTDPYKSDSDDDLLPDNYEIENGLDPINKIIKNRALKIINENGPFMDGVASEWEYLPYFYSVESIQETGSSQIDMSSLKIYQSDKGLYILVKTINEIKKIKNSFFDVLVDIDGDNLADMEYATYLDNKNTWVYDHKTATSTVYTKMKSGINEVAEIFIPNELINYSNFSILPIFHNASDEFNYDEWDYWINLDKNYLKGIKSYSLKTDLKSDDSDKDLIPDITELKYGLNPVKKDNKGKVKELGPFIDGLESEWKYFDTEIIQNRKNSSKYKIKDIQTIIKNDKLYIKVNIDYPSIKTENIMFDILIDTNEDKRHDYEIAYILNNPNYHWIYYVDENRSENISQIRLQASDIVEVEIPLSLFKYKSISILPIIRDIKNNINYDEFYRWYLVE